MSDKKTFKTYNEQIDILKSRNLIIDNDIEAIRFLELNNYYNVINGYKAPFLKVDKENELFIDNVHFQDIVKLYKVDKALSTLFFNEIIRIERIIKSIISYQFSSKYGITYDNGLQGSDYVYILPRYFNPDPYLHDKIVEFCASLSKLRNTCIDNRHDGRIIHYSSNGYIPFWVFVNVMSLGDISLFFRFMKPVDQSAVCAQLTNILQRPIDNKETQNCLKIITFIRNLCAHDQRLYDFSTKSTLTNSNLLVDRLKNNALSGITIATAAISQFCTNNQFNEFYSKLLNQIADLINFYKDSDIKNKVISAMKLRPILSDLTQL